MDPEAFRKDVYGRLEREDPKRWERLRGCTITHRVFGDGVVSKVLMPDWSNPVQIAIKFGLKEKIFYLSSFGDRTKFTAKDLPDQLAAALDQAEQEIGLEESRREEELQRKDREAREAVQRRKEQQATRAEQQRQAEAELEAARVELAETRLAEIGVKIDGDQSLATEDIRVLLENRRHELLLRYYEHSYARTNDHRPLVKACTTWRDAKQPEYALRVTSLLMDNIDRLSASSRATVLTARGGALLDLHRYAEAKECALQAIACNSKSAQPQALLAAILVENGESLASTS